MPSSDPIREWFERHREDYCDCVGSPPRAWAEYMSLLLDERDEAARKAIEAFAWRIVQQAAETTQRSFQVIFEAELEKVREAKDE
jgi:hypothetical protein